METGDENQSHFSYAVTFSPDLWSETACEERGYEQWPTTTDVCITTLQG